MTTICILYDKYLTPFMTTHYWLKK